MRLSCPVSLLLAEAGRELGDRLRCRRRRLHGGRWPETAASTRARTSGAVGASLLITAERCGLHAGAGVTRPTVRTAGRVAWRRTSDVAPRQQREASGAPRAGAGSQRRCSLHRPRRSLRGRDGELDRPVGPEQAAWKQQESCHDGQGESAGHRLPPRKPHASPRFDRQRLHKAHRHIPIRPLAANGKLQVQAGYLVCAACAASACNCVLRLRLARQAERDAPRGRRASGRAARCGRGLRASVSMRRAWPRSSLPPTRALQRALRGHDQRTIKTILARVPGAHLGNGSRAVSVLYQRPPARPDLRLRPARRPHVGRARRRVAAWRPPRCRTWYAGRCRGHRDDRSRAGTRRSRATRGHRLPRARDRGAARRSDARSVDAAAQHRRRRAHVRTDDLHRAARIAPVVRYRDLRARPVDRADTRTSRRRRQRDRRGPPGRAGGGPRPRRVCSAGQCVQPDGRDSSSFASPSSRPSAAVSETRPRGSARRSSATHDPGQLIQVVVESAVEATGAAGGVVLGPRRRTRARRRPRRGLRAARLPASGRLLRFRLARPDVRLVRGRPGRDGCLARHSGRRRARECASPSHGRAAGDGRQPYRAREPAEPRRVACAPSSRAPTRFGDSVCVVLADLDDFKR